MSRILPLILAVALFMENMDANIISTSLPVIAQDLNTSPIALKLALTAYLVSLAIFIPISGWMADRYTARRIFRIAIFIFMLGSLACALSNSLVSFVVSRFLQGMGGAMMTPLARLVLVRSTPRDQLVSAFAWLTIPGLVGPLVGPLVGGYITTYYSWHYIFLINIPIGIIGIIFASIYMPRNEKPILRHLDWPGFIFSACAMAGVIFGLSVISLPALPLWVGIVTVSIGFTSLFIYIFHARRTPNPLLDLNMFRNKVFSHSVWGGSLFRIGIGATPFLLPLMLQTSFGYSAFESGMVTFISALGAIGLKLGANRIYSFFKFRTVLMFGSLISACFTAINGLFTPATPYLLMITLLFIGGFLRSMFFTGAGALSFAEVAPEQVSQATPLSAVIQQISIAMGVAIAGSILEMSMHIHQTPLQLRDFHIAFYCVAAISALSFFAFYRLPKDAGKQLTRKKANKN